MAIATIPQTGRTISPATRDLEELRAHLVGELITADHSAYDTARMLHDISRDGRPQAIVVAAHTADVAEAVRFAAAHSLPLAVRSGGHSIAGHSSVDGVITVDLSKMRGVSIDAARRTARVEAGATSADIANPAHAYGLALSTGDTSTVGIGGLTTGGGIGWMVRKYGLAIDNLLSAEVVLADGSVVWASATENSDLFWAIRGGGGNFGIITEFEFRLAPVGQVLGGGLVLPGTREVIRGYLDYVATAPDDLTVIANLMHAPPAPFIPEDRIGELVLMVLPVWTGSLEDGERALAPLRALAEPVADAVGPIPYPAIYNFTEAAAAPHAASVRQMFANAVSDELIDSVVAAMERATTPYTMVQFRGMGGQMARVAPDATAFAHRSQPYFIALLGLWLDAAEDAAPHRAWVESLWSEVRGEAAGVYVNFLEDEGEGRVREAYPAATLERLVEVKTKYDPTNLFRFNQNILPRG